jgi:DNA-binding response OmpR family regulator
VSDMAQDQPLLLVENNEKEAGLLKTVLEGEGFSVDTAYSGWAAVEKIKDKKYATAIVDFALPDMKGDELAERFRMEDPKMGIILLTGFKPMIDPSRLRGFDYIFEKPASPKKILDVLKLARIPK